MRGDPSRRALSTPRARPSRNGVRSVSQGRVKLVRGSANTEVRVTPVSRSAAPRVSRSFSKVPQISTASKPAAAAARTRSA